MKLASTLTIALILPLSALADTIYVPDDFETIQESIEAWSDGDVIIVRPGIYIENIDYLGKPVTLVSEQGPAVTTIDGGNPSGSDKGSVVTFATGEGSDSIIAGFTICNGTGSVNPTFSSVGGGIYCLGSSPTITGNTITKNSAGWGGGIFCDNANPTIEENLISYNQGDWGGGGIYCYQSSPAISGNRISSNNGDFGGGCCFDGASSTVFTGNTVKDNWGSNGGGVCCRNGGSPTITACTISENNANRGGGISCFESPVLITGNTINLNNASSFGGGVYVLNTPFPYAAITGNIISRNTSERGGGICCLQRSAAFTANTVSANSATAEGGGFFCSSGINATVYNSIYWNNDAPVGPEIWLGSSSLPARLSIQFSDVEGGQALVHVEPGCTLNWGSGMIDADPQFFSIYKGDLHIAHGSPCRAAGHNSAPSLPSEDFEGDPRNDGTGVDIGADEFYPHLYHLGIVRPGIGISIRVIGEPGTTPVNLGFSNGIQDPPQATLYGDLYLKFPIKVYWLGTIPSGGCLMCYVKLPPYWKVGEVYIMQALLGPPGDPNSLLTNLHLLKVE